MGDTTGDSNCGLVKMGFWLEFLNHMDLISLFLLCFFFFCLGLSLASPKALLFSKVTAKGYELGLSHAKGHTLPVD